MLSVEEETPVGTLIGVVRCHDEDEGQNSDINYSITRA